MLEKQKKTQQYVLQISTEGKYQTDMKTFFWLHDQTVLINDKLDGLEKKTFSFTDLHCEKE
jgi:hypothetical protein